MAKRRAKLQTVTADSMSFQQLLESDLKRDSERKAAAEGKRKPVVKKRRQVSLDSMAELRARTVLGESGTLSAELRAAIATSGITAYSLGQRAKVSPAVISRFVTGERGLTLAVVDRLCQALNLTLAVRKVK